MDIIDDQLNALLYNGTLTRFEYDYFYAHYWDIGPGNVLLMTIKIYQLKGMADNGTISISDFQKRKTEIMGIHLTERSNEKNNDFENNLFNIENEVSENYANNIDNHEFVDLGLPSGILWATCNIGATKVTESGYYLSWGETRPKMFYEWDFYLLGRQEGDDVYVSKYCTDKKYGTVDNKNDLDPEDDAATVNWGPQWRMPTIEEQKELIDGCEWEMTLNFNRTGEAGQIGVSKYNGNTIFFPTCGHKYMGAIGDAPYCGYYWLSSSSNTLRGNCFVNGAYMTISDDWRFRGMNVRAVVAN